MNTIMGLINNQISEKEFSDVLLNITQKNEFDDKQNIIEDKKESEKEKKKLIFEIDSKKKKKEKEISDCFCNNYIKQKKEENNFLINIEGNELSDNTDISEIKNKKNNNNEPKKSKHYCVKTFTFEDFVLNKNDNN